MFLVIIKFINFIFQVNYQKDHLIQFFNNYFLVLIITFKYSPIKYYLYVLIEIPLI